MKADIDPSILEHAVPIDDLIPKPDNPRQGDVGEISLSLDRFTQQTAIKVTPDGLILKGNHTYKAAKALGWTHIAATVTSLPPEEWNAYALTDNRLSDLATTDHNLELEQIEELDDLRGTGYDAEYIDELREELDQPFDGHAGDERYTPEWVFEGMGVEFDIDLAAPAGGLDWITAKTFYTKDDDALSKDWTGQFAWCNPPYSIASQFGHKWVEEVTEGVWLGPQSNAVYRLDIMRGATGVWLPTHLEFHKGWADEIAGVRFPLFMAGFGERGRAALINLGGGYVDEGVFFDAYAQ